MDTIPGQGHTCKPSHAHPAYSGMQAAYSLVYAAQQATPQSTEARWLKLRLNGQLDLPSNPDSCGYLEALDLATAVRVNCPHDLRRQHELC